MKNIFFTFLILALVPLSGWSQNKVQLGDFEVQKKTMEEFNATYYSMQLKNGKEEIEIRVAAQPAKIVDSYFDEQYLVLVYQNEGGTHFLAGAYKYKDKWSTDYFHEQLDFSNGLNGKFVSAVKFVDGETLLVDYKFAGIKPEADSSKERLRITKDGIYVFVNQKTAPALSRKGNNPIRPVR